MPWSRLLGTSSVPVLCYHNTGGSGVPWASFEAQMHWLARSGVAALGLDGLRAFLGGEPLTRPGVVLTFDDGFRDLYTRVGPLLAELGLRGVVFVINNRVRDPGEAGTDGDIVGHRAHEAFLRSGDRSAWLSWPELEELVESGVLEVGSHSDAHAMRPVTEPNLDEIPDHWAYAPYAAPPVPRLAPELAGPLWLDGRGRMETEDELYARALESLRAGREALEGRLGAAVRSLAWPWGESHPATVRAARDAGFDLLFTLRRGAVERGGDPLGIRRLEVRRTKGLGWFASRMALYSRAWTANLYSAGRIG